MRILAAICVLALGVNAQVGPSGMVGPDGQQTQFSHNLAHDILLIGPAGIVTKSGQNLQLTSDMTFATPLPLAFQRHRRSATGHVSEKGNIGTAGILRADGTADLFSHDFAHDILLIGPAGIVTKSGQNLQLTSDLRYANPIPYRRRRSATGHVSEKGNIGTAGILRADGTADLFSHDFAHDILLIGPAGIVTKSGQNLQLTSDLRYANPIPYRRRRSVGVVSEKGNIGTAGILRADGSTDLFSHDFAHDILLIGPAGIVTKSGQNLQLTSDLGFATPGVNPTV